MQNGEAKNTEEEEERTGKDNGTSTIAVATNLELATTSDTADTPPVGE